MRNFDKKIRFCILLGILILSSIRLEVRAQSTLNVEIKTISDIDICGNKIFQIYIQTDEIYAVDSIVGFDIYIGYNDNKIQIDQMLTAGTLSAPLQNSGSEAVLSMNKTVKGEVWLSGAFFTNTKFLKGKQPLIALSGRYLNNCSDTTLVSILEFIPAYYDFSKYPPTIEYKHLLLKANVAVNSGRIFETYIKNNTFTISKDDSVGQIPIYFKNSDLEKTKSVELKLYTDKSNKLNIKFVEANQQGLHIDTSFTYLDTLYIRTSWTDKIDYNLPTLIIEISRYSKDTDTINLYANVVKLSDCNCVTSIINDSIIVNLEGIMLSVESETTYINSNSEIIKANDIDGSLIFTCEDGTINHVRIYNTLGEYMWNRKYREQIVYVPKYIFSYEVSFIEITHLNKNIETKKLIKYIK